MGLRLAVWIYSCRRVWGSGFGVWDVLCFIAEGIKIAGTWLRGLRSWAGSRVVHELALSAILTSRAWKTDFIVKGLRLTLLLLVADMVSEYTML